MKKLFLLSFSFLAFTASAQMEIDRADLYLIDPNNPYAESREEKKNLLNIGLGYHLNSSAITNDFFKGLLYQGFIDDSKKDQVTERLKDVNRGGYDLNGGLTYLHQLKPGLTLVVGLNQRQQFNAKFTKDIFEITFRGNKNYQGQKAEIGPTAINYFDYQNLFVGVQKNVGSKLVLGGGISFIRGGSLHTLRMERGTLFTAPDGSYLDFDMKFKLAFTESDNFFNSNGKGLALNWNASLLQEKGRINFEIRDLGFIQYNDVKTYEGDSVYRYEGIRVNDVFSFSTSSFSSVHVDSIAEDFNIKPEKKNFSFALPATLHLNYVRYFSPKFTLITGIKGMIRAAYLPRVYVKGLYYFNPRFFIAPVIAYGGFGKLDFELSAAKKFKDSFILSGNLFYLEYLLLPKKSSGQGFNISLTKLF